MMREFFNGWKRRIGVFTLLTALAFVGMWLRSQIVWDQFTFGSITRNGNHSLGFNYHGFWWTRDSTGNSSGVTYDSGCYREAFTAEPLCPLYFKTGWRWNWGGLDFGEYQWVLHNEIQSVYWRVSYWSIIAPLTLISALLLLSKPRQSNQTKIKKATANEAEVAS